MKTTLKSLFFSLLLLAFIQGKGANSELPKQNIRGRVIDKTTQMGLPGATIVLLNTSPLIGTTTDQNGTFKITGVNIGRVSLQISYIGFKDAVLSNLMLNTGKELIVEIALEESVYTQDEVVVKAEANKIDPINTMATVSARGFTVEETSRYAGSRNDVARMASNYAGVAGANDARNDIIIRGNSPIGLLWQLEGIPIPNPNHYGSLTATGGPVSMLNNNVLMNSDFITAAFPAVYGNALSGVFDLRMRNGNNEKHEFLGQVGFNGFEFGAEGPINKKNGSSYLLNGRYSTLELMDQLGADFGTGAGIPKYKDFTAKFNFPRTKIGSISLFVLGGISDIKIWDSERDTTDESLDFYGGEGYDLTNGSDMLTGGINHFYAWSKNTYTRITIAGSLHRFETNIDSLAPVTLNKTTTYQNNLNENTFSAKFVLNHRFNAKNNLNTGILFQSTGFNLVEKLYFDEDKALRNVTDYQGNSNLYQVFANWNHKFTDDIELNTGIHGIVLGLNGTGSVEPRIGFQWKVQTGQSIGLGYGLHSLVNPITVYYRQVRLPDGEFARLNKDLPLLKSHHLVLSYDYQLSPYLRLKAETYYQHLFNAAVDAHEKNSFSILNEGANFGVVTPDTLAAEGIGRNIGIELTLEHFLNKGFYYLITASLFDSKYKGSDEKWHNSAFNGNYVFNALFGKEWQLGQRNDKSKSIYTLGFDVKTTLAGGQRYTPSDVIPDPQYPGRFKLQFDDADAFERQYTNYARTDLKLTFKINGKRITQEFALDIQNLFDQQNIYTESFNKQTGEKSYTYQIGRLIIPQYRIIF